MVPSVSILTHPLRWGQWGCPEPWAIPDKKECSGAQGRGQAPERSGVRFHVGRWVVYLQRTAHCRTRIRGYISLPSFSILRTILAERVASFVHQPHRLKHREKPWMDAARTPGAHGQKTLRSRICPFHARPRHTTLFLAAPLACAAVTIHVGSCEKRLRDGKLATSSYVFRHVLLGRRQALCPVEQSEACWHWEAAETFAPLANTSASSLLSSTRWRISGSRLHGV